MRRQRWTEYLKVGGKLDATKAAQQQHDEEALRRREIAKHIKARAKEKAEILQSDKSTKRKGQ